MHPISVLLTALFPLACSPFPFRPSSGAHASKIIPIYQFPDNGSWIENIAVRCNGHILATRIDTPKLFSIDPREHTAKLVYTFEGDATSLLGITEVKKDVFALVAVNRTTAFTQGRRSRGFILTADFNHKPVVFRQVAVIEDSFFLNGIAPFSEDTVLVSDSGNGVLYRVNILTGDYTIAVSDQLFTPPNRGQFPTGGIGVNGLKIARGYAYFTSSTRNIFGRVPLTSQGVAVGGVEVLADTGTFLDDFILSRRGVAYATTNDNSTVLRIVPDGSFETIAGKNNTLTVAGPTCAAWVPRSRERELYVGTDGGQDKPINGETIEPAKIVKIVLRDVRMM